MAAVPHWALIQLTHRRSVPRRTLAPWEPQLKDFSHRSHGQMCAGREMRCVCVQDNKSCRGHLGKPECCFFFACCGGQKWEKHRWERTVQTKGQLFHWSSQTDFHYFRSRSLRSGSACRLSIRSSPPLSRSCGRCVPACRSPALGPFSSWRPTPRPAAPTRRPPPRNEPLRAPAPPLGPAPQPGPPFRVAPPRGGPRPGSGCGRGSLAVEPWRMRITSRAARRSGATKRTEERWALRARGGPAAGMRRLGGRSLGAGRGARRGVERKGMAARWAGLVPAVLQRVSGERVVCRGAACEQKRPAYGNRGGAPEIAEVADVLCLQPARWWGWGGRRWCWSPAGVPEKVFNPWLHHGAVDI